MSWYEQKEREGAQITGSRLHFSSGRGYEKHDYSNSEYLTEHKSVQGKKYKVRAKEVWNPLGARAHRQKKKPRLVICFTPAPGVEYWVEVLGPPYIRAGAAVWYDGSCRSRELVVRPLDTVPRFCYASPEKGKGGGTRGRG